MAQSILPVNFTFSQSSLQDYTDCPRRFQLRYIDAGGIRTRYIETGFQHGPDADAVVFIHGTGGHLEAFLKNIFHQHLKQIMTGAQSLLRYL